VEESEGLTRRRVARSLALGVTGAPIAAFLYAWRIEPHWLEIVRLDLPVEGLPAALEGRTLLQLSDLHIGERVDDDYLIDSLRRGAETEPDLVVLTGDAFDKGAAEHLDRGGRILEALPRGRLGTLAILGNHDYGPGWSHPEVAARVVERLEASGATVLRDAAVDIEGLRVVGLEDLWGPYFAAEEALRRASEASASIVLCHNPDAADRPVWGGFRGWILAGHTHGGQCKPPFLPPPMLPVANKRYTAGAFDLGAGRQLYINRGVGHLDRVRFNVRPEITLFRLTGSVT
jgi:predicted MPP superfamily phosphohydrolase